jgi:primosomal protein N'
MHVHGRIASVLLAQPLPEPFDYALPAGMDAAPGAVVVVPLGPREVVGVVWALKNGPPARPLKPVLAVIDTAPPIVETMRASLIAPPAMSARRPATCWRWPCVRVRRWNLRLWKRWLRPRVTDLTA